MPDTHTSNKQTREQRMATILNEALSPSVLRIINQSQKHEGHKSAPQQGEANYMESHYDIEICTERFAKLSRIERQRLVNDLLANEFTIGLHALSCKLYAPNEN